MKARRGDAPSTDVLDDRWQGWAVDRVALLLRESGFGGLTEDELRRVLRIRAVDGMHELTITTDGGTIVIGRLPVLDFANAYGEIAAEYIAELAGTLRLRRGRRAGSTTIVDDTRLCETVSTMDRERALITRATLAARAAYTEDEVRGYLRSTNRTFAELLHACRVTPAE